MREGLTPAAMMERDKAMGPEDLERIQIGRSTFEDPMSESIAYGPEGEVTGRF